MTTLIKAYSMMFWNSIIVFALFPILLITAYLLIKNAKFKKSNYRVESGNTFIKTIFDKGAHGEYLTFEFLETLSGYKKILTNIYIPKQNGKTTEIDIIMLHETGIYVFESKNYSGWIFGDEESKYWMQTLQSGKKSKFYNPIMQNQAHIKHLKALLNESDNQNIHSIIVFSERCKLKKVKINSNNIFVINRNLVPNTVKQIMQKTTPNLKANDIDNIYFKLKNYSNADDAVKQRHIESINSRSY